MDPNRFDDLLRALSETPTRRGIGRAVSALTLAGLLDPLFGPAGMAGKKRRRKKRLKCRGNKKTCRNKCIPKTACCTDGDCDTGERCCDGQCLLPILCPAEECACGEVCLLDPPVIECLAGGCPAGADPCKDPGVFLCDASGSCFCATSIDGKTVCADFAGAACIQCSSDAQCSEEFDQPAICIDPVGGACSCGMTSTTFCMPIGCLGISTPGRASGTSTLTRREQPQLGR